MVVYRPGSIDVQQQQFDFASIQIDRDGAANLSDQLYDALRDAILDGALSAGTRIPSTRDLSELLSVSRSTVKSSYAQLIAEGYLQTKAASSTFVSAHIPKPSLTPIRRFESLEPSDFASLSSYGRRLSQLQLTDLPYSTASDISFFSWRPALDQVPLEQWTRTLWRRTRQMDREMLDVPMSRLGSPRLREAIARHVRGRDIYCKPEQVIIVNGFYQALDLVCRVHLDEGESVVVEDPVFPQVRETFRTFGGVPVPVRVDEGGFSIDEMKTYSRHRPKMAYLTPSHQFPTGAIMSLPRRLELLEYANANGIILVEDDYDSEFRYGGSPIPALMGLDDHHCVVYIASFSKLIYPSLAMAYLIVPERFAQIYANARTSCSDAFPMHLQESVADFIDEGNLSRHIKKMTALYDRRRRAMVTALKKYLGERVTIYGDNAGIHLLARIDSDLPDTEIVSGALARGVALVSTAIYYANSPVKGEFSMGYGDVTEEQIDEGIRRVAEIFH
jgi:GntR family transcriptional regulator/MocR family aminotransferase